MGSQEAGQRDEHVTTLMGRLSGRVLLERGVDDLEGGEFQVFPKHSVAHRRQQTVGVTTAGEITGNQMGYLLHLLLHVHLTQYVGKSGFAIYRATVGDRDALWGHVEKPVQVDAHSGVQNGPEKLYRWGPLQGLMQGVCRCEGVVDSVPVSEFVACLISRKGLSID